MKTLDGVNWELRARVEGVIAEAEFITGIKGVFWVESAYRSPEKQAELYALFVSGKGNPANKPGTSLHERGLAVDVGCAAKWNALRASLFRKWGLCTPYVKKEPWHCELDPARKPLAIPAPAPAPAQTQSIEDDEMPKPDTKVDACIAPNGGVWTLTYDGGVRAERGAPFYGSYPGLPEKARQGVRNFIAIVREGDGYTLIADDAGTYHFNAEVWAQLQRSA